MGKIVVPDVPSAFQRMVDKYYKPNEYDQIPFKFPDDSTTNHLQKPTFLNEATQATIVKSVQETTLRSVEGTILVHTEPSSSSTLSTIFENAATNATQEVTSSATDVLFGQEVTSSNATSVGNNVTALIDEVFGSGASSTEASATNFTLDAATDFTGNSTERTDLVTFVNGTMREVGSTYMPERAHGEENTALIILGVVIGVLLVSVIVGFLVYYHKKRAVKRDERCEEGAQGRLQGGRILSIPESVRPFSARFEVNSQNQTSSRL